MKHPKGLIRELSASSCHQLRLVRIKYNGYSEPRCQSKGVAWLVKYCATPLFNSDEKLRGTCSSCHKGWKTKGNRPMTLVELNKKLGRL